MCYGIRFYGSSRKRKGVQYAKEASGYKSDQYIWRYVKPSQQSLAAAIDELEA
jgi:hypothetical protein